MENQTVAILLAIYEPREDWLVELLDSLNAQTYPHLKLYVRDDASPTYPFEALPPEGEERYHWDFSRFDPAYFRHLEKAVSRLGELGIEADLIVLHPYDRWGFSHMTQEQDVRYIRYLVSRSVPSGMYGGQWRTNMT